MSHDRFRTDVLDAALNRTREANERLRIATLARLQVALRSVPAAFSSVVVFGSVVRPGCFGPESDVDVAFEGLSDDDYFGAKRYLEGELMRDVDVVQLESSRLSGSITRGGVRWNPNDS